MERQIFLYLLWEEARDHEEEILADIRAHFNVLKRFEVTWPQREFIEHLEAFYGHTSAIWRAKANRDGMGSFLVILVEDEHPRFERRKSLGGVEQEVDVNVYDAKKRYRKLLKSKDRVHSSVTLAETRHNFCLLTGRTLADWLAEEKADGALVRLVSEQPRYWGWKSLEQVFTVLNECMDYVVLRNAGTFDAMAAGDHPDIDMLVSGVDTFAAITGATRMSPKPRRTAYALKVGGKVLKFDLREPGDGYYDPSFASDILARAEWMAVDGSKTKLRVPGGEDRLYSLLYHALLHKKEVSPDYAAFFERNGLAREQWKEALAAWLSSKGYAYCRPLDPKVAFNEANLLPSPPLKRLPRSFAHICSFALSFSKLRLHLFTGTGLPNLFRLQLRLGGLFKIDICVGQVKEIET
ncbi:MAG: hypothetical protein J5985_01790 [Kiritimatiellae bacterium]|nr:hypothetical protein [Kiritimatiellia bacterium]